MIELNQSPSLETDRTESAWGSYDDLYRQIGIVWPDRPGRMVRLACDLLPAGRALDAGCGDGKNADFLASHGWEVTAFDVSPLALNGLASRLAQSGSRMKACFQADAAHLEHARGAYDLVVAYGLFHCLNDVELAAAEHHLQNALRPGGLFAVAVFNDELPVPPDHGTTKLFLRSKERAVRPFLDWQIEACEHGTIEEDHYPVVDLHRHSVSWILARKPQSE
jgi:SAM-dependent methyltransferase